MAKFVFTQSSSDYSRMQQNLIEAGARSWTPLGSLQRSPDLPAGREGLPQLLHPLVLAVQPRESFFDNSNTGQCS